MNAATPCNEKEANFGISRYLLPLCAGVPGVLAMTGMVAVFCLDYMRVGLLSLLIVFVLSGGETQTPEEARNSTAPERLDFVVKRPNFIVRGNALSRVEIWCYPTGTGVTKPALLGRARRTTRAGRNEIWSLLIPGELLATQVFVEGYDKRGKLVARRYLPDKGATAVYNALHL